MTQPQTEPHKASQTTPHFASQPEAQAKSSSVPHSTPHSTPHSNPHLGQVSDSSINPELEKLAQQNAELIGDLQRTRADFENFRKQVDLQREQAKNLAKHATVSKFLPLIDDMSRAIKAHPDLLAPVQKTLDKTLKSLNLSIIDSNVGTTFNPEFHNAISMEDDDSGKEVIAEELIPGYLYEDQVLRAAMVRVKHQ